jgi:hypothetical protein
MHGYPEKLVLKVRIGRPEPALPKGVRVYPRLCSAATEWRAVFGPESRLSRIKSRPKSRWNGAIALNPIVYLHAVPILTL